MSYVIQNFNTTARHLVLTPKLKSLIILNNLEKIFTFFKVMSNLFFFKNVNTFAISHFFTFLKYFYGKQLMNLLIKSNISSFGFYTGNFHKSLNLFIFKNILLFFKSPKSIIYYKTMQICDSPVCNLYYASVKIISSKVNKKFYKNIFFFYMLTFSFFWYQHTSFFKFYLNFIISNPSFFILPFYSGYFLHVYNV